MTNKGNTERTYYTICHLCGEETRRSGATNARFTTNAHFDGYRWDGCGVSEEEDS